MSSEDQAPTPAYLWFDSEFTSLEPHEARLLQVSLLVTDSHLRRLTRPEQDLNLHIRLDAGAPVSAWVAGNLADVLRRCRSADAVPVAEADARLAALVDAVVGPPSGDIRRRPVLAGNTVHMDLNLVRLFLPEFARRLHYRLLDVSTLKILWGDWTLGPAFEKKDLDLMRRHLPPGFELPPAGKHDAYFDLHASIAEFNYYSASIQLSCGQRRGPVLGCGAPGVLRPLRT